MKLNYKQYIFDTLHTINNSNDINSINTHWEEEEAHKSLRNIRIYSIDLLNTIENIKIENASDKNSIEYLKFILNELINSCELSYPDEILDEHQSIIHLNLIKANSSQLIKFIEIIDFIDSNDTSIKIENILRQTYDNLSNAYDYAFDENNNYDTEDAYTASSMIFTAINSLEIIRDNLVLENKNDHIFLSDINEKIAQINAINNKMYDANEQFIDESYDVFEEINQLLNNNVIKKTSSEYFVLEETKEIANNTKEEEKSDFRKKIRKIM